MVFSGVIQRYLVFYVLEQQDGTVQLVNHPSWQTSLVALQIRLKHIETCIERPIERHALIIIEPIMEGRRLPLIMS